MSSTLNRFHILFLFFHLHSLHHLLFLYAFRPPVLFCIDSGKLPDGWTPFFQKIFHHFDDGGEELFITVNFMEHCTSTAKETEEIHDFPLIVWKKKRWWHLYSKSQIPIFVFQECNISYFYMMFKRLLTGANGVDTDQVSMTGIDFSRTLSRFSSYYCSAMPHCCFKPLTLI